MLNERKPDSFALSAGHNRLITFSPVGTYLCLMTIMDLQRLAYSKLPGW